LESFNKNKILCPSSTCKPGAILLGIVLPNGKVAVSSTEYIIEKDFVEKAKAGRLPEDRFRFSSPCISSKCGNWENSKCRLIGKLKEEVDESVGKKPQDYDFPDCAIQKQCRWFLQNGKDACYYCEFLVRGTGEVRIES